MIDSKKQRIRVASYRRVSTAGQAIEGLSLDEQAGSLRQFVEQQGWELLKEYEDAGRSGLKDFRSRPGFRRMLADALAGKFDVLVVSDMTRFSRSPKDYFAVAGELEQAGISLLTLDNPNYDQDDEGQVLGREIQVVIGKFTARQSRAKSIRVKQAKLDRGEFNLGQRIPYGLRWTDKQGRGLEHDPKTYPVWCLIKTLRQQGWGYGRIAAALNGKEDVPAEMLKKFKEALPVPNRYGQKVWREGAIAGMFRDESRVTGRAEINFKPIIGGIKTYTIDFPPLMTRREFNSFSKMTSKNLTWVPRNVGKGSILSGLCRCGICGATFHVTGSRGFGYYGCRNHLRPRKGDTRCPLPLIPKKKLERRVLYSLGEFLRDDATFNTAMEMANIALRDSVAALAKLDRDEARLLKAEKQCQRKLDRLIDAIADGTIGKRDAKAKRQEIAEEEADNEMKGEQLARQRALLERTASQAKQISRSRQRILKQFGQVVKLVELADQEKQDLLRALLPPDADAGIIVHKADPRDEVGPWYIEFSGILPIGEQNIKSVVLGGALAVP